MELKDWLLLFIPIIFNGFLIWLFQYTYKNRMEQQATFRALREDIFKKYIEKITQSILACKNLYSAQSDAKIDNDKSLKKLYIALYDLRMSIRELYYYFETYKIILSTNDNVASKHDILKKRFEEWVSNWYDFATQNNFIHDCEDILQDILNESLKYIYGIKR